MSDHVEPSRTGRGLPLWARIARAVLIACLVVVCVAGAYLSWTLGDSAQDRLEERLRDELELLTPPVRSALRRGSIDEIREITDRGRLVEAVRITVVLPDGDVIAESAMPLPLANHAGRPEIADALRTGEGRSRRSSSTVGESFLYWAKRLDDPGGRTLGVLRLALPLAEVERTRDEVVRALLAAAVLVLPFALLLAWRTARRIARPLEELTATAARMAAGDFDDLPRGEGDSEGGRLAEALRRTGVAFRNMLEASDAERRELDAILGSMTEGVLALDREERVLRANQAAADCLGLREIPGPGTPLASVCRVPELFSLVRDSLEGGARRAVDLRLPGTAGRTLEAGATPLTTTDGEIRGAVAVFRDVTVMRKLEHVRLDFVANVSHELRTPLAAVLSSIETVADLGDEEPQARTRLLATAVRHGKRLAAIVDDLLALSEIESEGDRLERAPIPVLRGIRSAALAVADDAAARRVSLEFPPVATVPVRVLGHEGRLEQVWVNLLANAVKYNREGGTVKVDVTTDPQAREAEVSISDTGQGIPQGHLDRIFERFYRVDKARSRDQGGTGLGLAIVKHIVRSHRGRIEVRSVPGEGTTFLVRLPLAP